MLGMYVWKMNINCVIKFSMANPHGLICIMSNLCTTRRDKKIFSSYFATSHIILNLIAWYQNRSHWFAMRIMHQLQNYDWNFMINSSSSKHRANIYISSICACGWYSMCVYTCVALRSLPDCSLHVGSVKSSHKCH